MILKTKEMRIYKTTNNITIILWSLSEYIDYIKNKTDLYWNKLLKYMWRQVEMNLTSPLQILDSLHILLLQVATISNV